MIAFAELYANLDSTTKTSEKVEFLARYFRQSSPSDSAWAIYFLSGRKPKRLVNANLLRTWATEAAQLPEWLFQESYDLVGDLAETIALLLPIATERDDRPLSHWITAKLLPLQSMDEEKRKSAILEAWAMLDPQPRFVWNKLITGAFRVGVSQLLVVRAIAEVSQISAAVISHRLMGDWHPSAEFYEHLISPEPTGPDPSKPYPFFLAHPIECETRDLGEVGEWQVEWKWDGIRSQLIRRAGQTFLWSRGEELVTDRYPEIAAMAEQLPDGTVIDGELLPWREGQVQPFADLQKRIGRKSVTKKLLSDVPIVLLAYDLLEFDGIDLRETPIRERRAKLESFVQSINDTRLSLSETVQAATWDQLTVLRSTSRSRGVEGFMLKRLDSPYRVGRVRGDWWKWKIEPMTMDAVLTAAQRGHGKRASLYSDYTFAIWVDDKLVTIAKAYSGLTDAEIREVDKFVKANTLESFGPVRTVKPELVFEIGFEGVNASTRHKSGIAVRFPRILRQRTDKTIREADTIETVKKLLLREPSS